MGCKMITCIFPLCCPLMTYVAWSYLPCYLVFHWLPHCIHLPRGCGIGEHLINGSAQIQGKPRTSLRIMHRGVLQPTTVFNDMGGRSIRPDVFVTKNAIHLRSDE